MKRLLLAITLIGAMSALGPAQAAPIVLTISGSTEDVARVSGITVGNTLSFEFQFTNVVYTSSPNMGLNASIVDPCCNSLFNTYFNSNGGWFSSGPINTSAILGLVGDLDFRGSAYNTAGNSATITIRNVAVDGRVISAAVPEPGTLALLGLGLVGLGLSRRRRAS